MKRSTTCLKRLAMLLAITVLPAFVWGQAYVVVPGGNRVQVEKILVRPDGSLVVTIGGEPRDIPKDKYVQAVGIKPAGIDQAQALMNEGKNDEATKVLTKILSSSKYQSWDAFAGEKLAVIQLGAGEHLQAKRTLDSLGRRYGDNMISLFPFLEKVQWDVKVKSSDVVGLEDELTEIIKGQNEPLRKARALLVRGDLKASRKDFQSAVLDYLRVNYFFGDNPELGAEALYKTANAFAKIGDTGRLRKYTTLLKETYPNSEFSLKIGS